MSGSSSHPLPLYLLDVGAPLAELAAHDGNGVLAIITAVDGPSYRPVGAMMAFLANGQQVGSLSSGCVEADLALHAKKALKSGNPVTLRYGKGSPFFDIVLPCGGGLEILLVPRPSLPRLQQAHNLHETRQSFALAFNVITGLSHIAMERQTGFHDGLFHVRIVPETRFLIFGKGTEALIFAGLLHAAHYSAVLMSHDAETLLGAQNIGLRIQRIHESGFPEFITVDQHTAAALFYHEHEREIPVLEQLLCTNAFYIGAQGSLQARETRLRELVRRGVSPVELARLHGPIGLVRSARDPRTLAVSVLAEILEKMQKIGETPPTSLLPSKDIGRYRDAAASEA
ncbi:XdhC family protein [Aureimonas fodinaquatilis]|uniref:XdhC family protein n=1 Tax=Aureimonas fodinaquatilis TaxID=2565783 RepID=A0A5B0E233_9HYPH|nr:XdhC family protein [Aureimonas fodinaquatilis]